MSAGSGRDRPGAAVSRRAALTAGLASLASAAIGCTRGSTGTVAVPTVAASSVTLAIVGILVADLGRSFGFYRLLGLDLPDTPEGGSYRLRMPNGHVLFWETAGVVHSFDPAWELPAPADRRIVLEFGFPTPGTLDATYDALVAAGAPGRLAPFDQGGGIRYAIVLDPDGNQIALRHPAS